MIENRIPVQISCPILKVNYDSYKDVQRWAVDHNISVGIDFSIIARYNHNQENLGCRLSYEELEHIISEKIINDSEYIEDLKRKLQKTREKQKILTYVVFVIHLFVLVLVVMFFHALDGQIKL